MKIVTDLTQEEWVDVMLARVEIPLRSAGVSLSAATRERLRAVLSTLDKEEGVPVRQRKTRAEVAGEEGGGTAAHDENDNRARVYHPTDKAKLIDNPTSTRDRVLNLIIQSKHCMMSDLLKAAPRTADAKQKRKAVYTALWSLKKAKLIEIESLVSFRATQN